MESHETGFPPSLESLHPLSGFGGCGCLLKHQGWRCGQEHEAVTKLSSPEFKRTRALLLKCRGSRSCVSLFKNTASIATISFGTAVAPLGEMLRNIANNAALGQSGATSELSVTRNNR